MPEFWLDHQAVAGFGYHMVNGYINRNHFNLKPWTTTTSTTITQPRTTIMSMDQLLGRGTRKSAATMMAAATADPEINITDADYPKERSARVDQTSIELEICLNQPVLEMLEAKKSEQTFRRHTGFCNFCWDFKYIRLMECTKCRFSICVSAVDGMAMGCIKEPEEGIPFKCPSCYMKSKVVPPVSCPIVYHHLIVSLISFISFSTRSCHMGGSPFTRRFWSPLCFWLSYSTTTFSWLFHGSWRSTRYRRSFFGRKVW